VKDRTVEYGVVAKKIWETMLRVGHSLDIDSGGFYDSRSGAINVWASPNDKPDGWEDVEITCGALNYPRSYVGGVLGEYDDNFQTVHLTLDVSPYGRWDKERFRSPVTDAEVEWLRMKVSDLIGLSMKEMQLQQGDGIYCQYCDRPIKVSLLNDFLHHLTEIHGVQVNAVVLGESTIVETNAGMIRI